MQALANLETARLKEQLEALQAWIRDLSVENAALRQRLNEYEAGPKEGTVTTIGLRRGAICSGVA